MYIKKTCFQRFPYLWGGVGDCHLFRCYHMWVSGKVGTYFFGSGVPWHHQLVSTKKVNWWLGVPRWFGFLMLQWKQFTIWNSRFLRWEYPPELPKPWSFTVYRGCTIQLYGGLYHYHQLPLVGERYSTPGSAVESWSSSSSCDRKWLVLGESSHDLFQWLISMVNKGP